MLEIKDIYNMDIDEMDEEEFEEYLLIKEENLLIQKYENMYDAMKGN